MHIFITGASGFVGGAVVKALKAEHRITAMSRSAKSDAAIAALGAESVRSALGEVKPEQLKGVDAIVHCAAHVEAWGPWADFWKFNVEGTRQLLDAAKKAGVKRFVHIGTEAALFRGQHMRDIDETYPLALNSPYPYSRTKAHAEKLVRAANDPKSGFTTIVIRPRLVWGPGDTSVLPEVAAMAKAGKFMWINGGAAITSTTYIGNLVHGVTLALTKGQGGEAYFVLDGKPQRFRDFMTRLTTAAGVKLPDKSIPGGVVRSLSFVTEKIWRGLGIKSPPPLPPRFVAAIMSRDCTIRDDKARRDLGYAPVVSVEDGLKAVEAERGADNH